MTAGEWELIKSVFDCALAVEPAQRAAYVESAATGHPEVSATVMELLRNHKRLSSSLSGSPAGRALTAHHAPALAPGTAIAGRFRVIRFIAAGGMGEVYEIFDERLNFRLALKTLRSDLAIDADSRSRFQREILVSRCVAHENVCRVYDFLEHQVEESVMPCLTMELLDGESLAELLARERPLSLDRALVLAGQIAAGLGTLHENGIVHRDLKPSNIMLATRAAGGVRAVVMDFGLSKFENTAGEMFESRGGYQVGAPYFLAPEILRGCRPSPHSDIYSFGLLLDEMVTRERAFSGSSLHALFFAKLWEAPASPRLRAPELPERWEQAILRCLQPEPESRFGTPLEVVEALTGGAPPVALATPRAAARRHPWLTRRRALALPVAACATAAAVALKPVDTSVDVYDIENLSGSEAYTYLCRGTSGELKRRLIHVAGVRVVPVYQPRSGKPTGSASRFSLGGMLQARDGQIRMSVDLIDNRDNSLVWSENFDRRRIENPLEVQSEIARGAVMGLENRLVAGARVRRWLNFQGGAGLPGSPTNSNVAFDHYLRGHNLLEELSAGSARAALDYFKRAIDADPSFALAYAAAADAHLQLMNYDVAPSRELAAGARENATQAVNRDPNLAEAHMVLGAVRQIDWEWTAAEQSFHRALELKPGLARARRWYGGLILQFKRFDEAIAETRHAMDQDPYDRSTAASLGMYLFLARRYRESVEVLNASIALKGISIPGRIPPPGTPKLSNTLAPPPRSTPTRLRVPRCTILFWRCCIP